MRFGLNTFDVFKLFGAFLTLIITQFKILIIYKIPFFLFFYKNTCPSGSPRRLICCCVGRLWIGERQINARLSIAGRLRRRSAPSFLSSFLLSNLWLCSAVAKNGESGEEERRAPGAGTLPFRATRRRRRTAASR